MKKITPGPPGYILELWVVYAKPDDYPNGYVLRRQWTMPDGQIFAEAVPRIASPSLDDVLREIPEWLTRLERMEGDVPSILETWI